METATLGERLQAGGQYALAVATEHMAALMAGWRPPTQRLVRQGGREGCVVDVRVIREG